MSFADDLENLESARDKVAQALVDQQQIASQAAQNAAQGEPKPQPLEAADQAADKTAKKSADKAGDKAADNKDTKSAAGKPADPKAATDENADHHKPDQTPAGEKAQDNAPPEKPLGNQALAQKQAANDHQTAEARKEIGDAAKEAEFVNTFVTMQRKGRSEELIGPAVFLASEASSYVTGAIFMVDGGYSAI